MPISVEVVEVIEVAGIGQRVEVNDFVFGPFGENESDKRGTDKTGTTSNEERAHLNCRFYGLTRTVPFPWFGLTKEKEETGKLWQPIRRSRLDMTPSSSGRSESVAIHVN